MRSEKDKPTQSRRVVPPGLPRIKLVGQMVEPGDGAAGVFSSSQDIFDSEEAKAVLRRSIEVFGDETMAREWFLKEVPTLGTKPYLLLKSAENRQAVLNVLGRAEHGVY